MGMPRVSMARKEAKRVCIFLLFFFFRSNSIKISNVHSETSYSPLGHDGPSADVPLEQFIPPDMPGYRPLYIQGPTATTTKS